MNAVSKRSPVPRIALPMDDCKLIKFVAKRKSRYSSSKNCSSLTKWSIPLTMKTKPMNTVIQPTIIQFTDPLDTVEISTPNSQKNYNFSCQFTDLTLSVRECNFQ